MMLLMLLLITLSLLTASSLAAERSLSSAGSTYKYIYQKSWYYINDACSGQPSRITATPLNTCLEIYNPSVTFYIQYYAESQGDDITIQTSYYSDSACTTADSSNFNADAFYDLNLRELPSTDSESYVINTVSSTCFNRGTEYGYTLFSLSASDLEYPTENGFLTPYYAHSDSSCSSTMMRGYTYMSFGVCVTYSYSDSSGGEWTSKKYVYHSNTSLGDYYTYHDKYCSESAYESANSEEGVDFGLAEYTSAACEEQCEEDSVNGVTDTWCRQVKLGLLLATTTTAAIATATATATATTATTTTTTSNTISINSLPGKLLAAASVVGIVAHIGVSVWLVASTAGGAKTDGDKGTEL